MNITMLTGGGRSGKSRKALELASEAESPCFLATAESLDEEMKERISAHQEERGSHYINLEEPIKLAKAIEKASHLADVVIVDCLTVWLGNMMHHLNHEAQEAEINDFIDILQIPPCELILVTNEVGMGIIPENAMAREFRDLAGILNQTIAQLADEVILMVSGLPLTIKTTF